MQRTASPRCATRACCRARRNSQYSAAPERPGRTGPGRFRLIVAGEQTPIHAGTRSIKFTSIRKLPKRCLIVHRSNQLKEPRLTFVQMNRGNHIQAWQLMSTDGPMTILVVDDELLINEMTSDDLRAAGHEVVSVYEADQAIDILEHRNDIDTILTDIDMPRLDGRTAACGRSAQSMAASPHRHHIGKSTAEGNRDAVRQPVSRKAVVWQRACRRGSGLTAVADDVTPDRFSRRSLPPPVLFTREESRLPQEAALKFDTTIRYFFNASAASRAASFTSPATS